MTKIIVTLIGNTYTFMDRGLRWCENLSAVIAGIVLLVTMVLVALDVVLRYFLKAPLQFQYNLTENYLLIALISMALAWGYRTGGYIRIDGMISRLPAKLTQLLLRTGLVVSGVYLGVLAWKGGQYFLDAYIAGDVHIGLIDWSVSWSWVWVPVGCGLLALRLFLIAVGPVHGLSTEHDLKGDV